MRKLRQAFRNSSEWFWPLFTPAISHRCFTNSWNLGNNGNCCTAAPVAVVTGRINQETTEGRDEKGFFGPELPEEKNDLTKQHDYQRTEI